MQCGLSFFVFLTASNYSHLFSASCWQWKGSISEKEHVMLFGLVFWTVNKTDWTTWNVMSCITILLLVHEASALSLMGLFKRSHAASPICPTHSSCQSAVAKQSRKQPHVYKSSSNWPQQFADPFPHHIDTWRLQTSSVWSTQYGGHDRCGGPHTKGQWRTVGSPGAIAFLPGRGERQERPF